MQVFGERLLQYVQNSQHPPTAERFGMTPGVGIAAPQVNVSKQILAVHVEIEEGKFFSSILYNPEIVTHSEELIYLPQGEGCLSVDEDIEGIVPRYSSITAKAMNKKGEKIVLNLDGILSIVFQHEIDHLNGVMFFDHIDKTNPLTPPENSKALGE